jgi:hypothetical protein
MLNNQLDGASHRRRSIKARSATPRLFLHAPPPAEPFEYRLESFPPKAPTPLSPWRAVQHTVSFRASPERNFRVGLGRGRSLCGAKWPAAGTAAAEALTSGTTARQSTSWLAQLWFTRSACGDDEQGDVVLVLGGEHVVREGSWCDGLDVEPCFFQHLSRSTLFDGLAKLQMPSGRSPSASTVRADAFGEQNERPLCRTMTPTPTRGARCSICELARPNAKLTCRRRLRIGDHER